MSDEPHQLHGSFPIVELRQYTLHDHRRDELIDLFEREFVESQEAEGMKVVGSFIDLDRPNRFVWLRGFRNLDARLAGLTAFYGGPVWKAHREAANATMIDSDNVLLLHAADEAGQFDLPLSRPAPGDVSPSGLIVATIYYLKGSQAVALPAFEEQVRPLLEEAGIRPLAWFVPESADNNFPRLPVRHGENLLVWFAAFRDEADHAANAVTLKQGAALLAPFLAQEPEILRLKPTSRSLIRGTAAPVSAGEHDFDFLHGRWNVHHRLLKVRGANSEDWAEYRGTAETRPLLEGLSNVEEHRISGRESGIALRCFDKASKRWAIYWAGDRDGILGPPVHGKFNGPEGLFEGEDTHDGRPVKVRFVWSMLSRDEARWEQAFSFDGGKEWETNWVMQFDRAS